MNDVVTQLNGLLPLPAEGGAPVEKCGIETTHTHLDTVAAVREAALAFMETPDAEGWLCFADRVVWPFTVENRGELDHRLLLYGEMANEAGDTWSLRQGSQGWDLWVHSRQAEGDHLVWPQSYLVREEGCGDASITHLKYEDVWALKKSLDGYESYQPHVTRFVGFKRGGE